MMARARPCSAAVRRGRLAKAKQFRRGAELLADTGDDDHDLADAYVTLCIHAGIAAADVICCARLARHAQGDNHSDAVDLLASVSATLAASLDLLLKMKTRSAYSELNATAGDRRRAQRAADKLLAAAQLVA
jgi:hypothetical protein